MGFQKCKKQFYLEKLEKNVAILALSRYMPIITAENSPNQR